MKKSFLALLLLVSFSLQAADYGVGAISFNPIRTGVPLLSIAPDSRAGGMGDVGAATSPDVNSQYWNPAKFAFMKGKGGLGISYTPWLSKLVNDINLANMSGYWRFSEGQAVSASLRFFSLGEVTFRQDKDDPGIQVNPNELAVDVAYSRLLAERWSAAVALRYIRSDLNTGVSYGTEEMYAANGVAADIAVLYSQPIAIGEETGNLAFGLNISNIGTKISYDKGNTSSFIPTNFRLGGSVDLPIDSHNKISVSADINKLLVPTYPVQREGEDEAEYRERENDYESISSIGGIFRSFSDAPGGFKEEMQEIMWSAGLEYSYANQFFVRGGYFNEAKNKGNRKYFTAGVGFRLNVFQIDAAYVIAVSQSNPLDQTLRFSLGFDLAGLKALAQ
jgi:hypothetical protein